MASQTKTFVGNAAAKSQVWALSPPIVPGAKTWSITCNGKTLTLPSTSITDMLKLWNASTFPEFREIKATAPTTANPASNPQGDGTNEIQALYITGTPTSGSFQVAWGGVSTPFLVDPTTAPSVADSGSSGNPSGAYKYTYTFLNINALGEIGETEPSEEGTVTVSSKKITVTVPVGPSGTIGRRVYRTAAAGATGTEKLVATIWDNGTTSFTDNVADGSLGAAQPTSNTTGIAYNATAAQLQGILQTFSSITPGNVVVTGSGTTAAPWLVQFTNTLGSAQRDLIGVGSSSFNYAVTVPAGITPALVASRIQQGLAPNAVPNGVLLLVSKTGVPFHLTSQVTGLIPPEVHVTNTSIQPPPLEKLTINATQPTISVSRTATGKAGSNEIQRIQISPNAESGSYFTLTFGANTTGNIPTPPSRPTIAAGASGSLTGDYYYTVTFLTANGETEPSAPSDKITLTAKQATVTITTGPTGTTKRRIYRTLAGGSVVGPYYLVTTVADNTTTSYTDNNTDATIALNPQPPTTNGCLLGELEALASVGTGNVQVSGANASSYSGQSFQAAYTASPPDVATAGSSTTAPTVTSITAGKAGGALATGTYYYMLTSVDAKGETVGSAESSAAVTGPTGLVAINYTAGANAKGVRVYRGTTSGGESQLIGTASATATSFVDYGDAPAPVAYTVEFINDLKNAAQDLLTGSVANVTVLPTIDLAETQAGYPIQTEIQKVGWVQQFGTSAPGGSFTIAFPSLNFTTGFIAYNATAATVLSAIQAAAPLVHHDDFDVTLSQGTSSGQIYRISYKGSLLNTQLPLAVVNVAAMQAASGDTVSPYTKEVQPGSPTGRNEIATVTINNSPTGGTFTLTGTLANGNTISASSVAYNASAATLQAAFPAGTTSVSGSAGGPYTIEAVGEAGAQRVIWQAASSLTGASSNAGSPPASNTTGTSAPAFSLTAWGASPGSVAGTFSIGTYYYKVTAITAAGETDGTEHSVHVNETGGYVKVSITSVLDATGYNIYRGASSGSESIKVASNISATEFWDSLSSAPSSNSPPGTNTAGISPPSIYASFSDSDGNFAADTYYYVATAVTGSGETTASSEISTTISAGHAFRIGINAVSGATSYRIYRGTTSGTHDTLVGEWPFDCLALDNGSSYASDSPPASNGTQLSAPVQSDTTSHDTGGNLTAGTYYYEITATTSTGETTASNEKSGTVTTGTSGSIDLSWNTVTGAAGYRIYRGSSSGGENVLVAVIASGATTSYTDTGNAPAIFTAASLVPGAAAVNETQIITVNNAGGGYFIAGFDGQSTNSIAWNAPATTMQTALEALSTIGSSNCTVSLSSSAGQAVYTVTFAGDLAAQPLALLSASDVPVNIPPASSNGFPSPAISAQFGDLAGVLPAAKLYYKVTAIVPLAGETAASNEVSITTTGSGTPGSSVKLTWASNASDVGYKVYRGLAQGEENYLVATLVGGGGAVEFTDYGHDTFLPTLQPGSAYTASLSSGGTDSFTLSYGGDTTSSIAYNATASTVQSDLEGLASIGSGNVTVSGSAGGPWTIKLVNSVIGSNVLTGTVLSTVTQATPKTIYVVSIKDATAGTLSISYGGSATVAYNATAARVKSALEGTSIGSGNVTVTGNDGGPWTITITPTPQNAGFSLAADGSGLVGKNATINVYPLVYCYATGPNFWDAPANWADGAVPSAYLTAAPVISNIVPLATDATLVDGTHGSLTTSQTYYYKVSATNANGETNGSTEQSATPFAGCKFYFNGVASAGTFDLTYGGQTASSIAYNASAATIQSDLEGLSTIGSGNCTVMGTGGASDPFVFQLAGDLAGTAPTPLSVDASSLTGATMSVYNTDTRSLAIVWGEIPTATGYKVYRGTSAGTENVLVATLTSPDQTCFIDDGTYTTTAASPNTSGSAYHTAVGDDVYFTASTVSCWYGIGAAISNGYSVHGGYRGSNYTALNSLTIDSTYTGRIGLPAWNTLGYQEYRPLALELNGPPSGTFSIDIGSGTGAGSPFIDLDTGTSQILMVVNGMGTSTAKTPALLWVGQNASSEIDLFKGSLGIAIYPSDVAQLGTIRQAYRANPKTDTTLQIGAGCETVTTFYKNGGDTLLSTDVTTLVGKAGTITQDNGAITTLTLENCTYTSKSTAALGAVSVSAGGKFDRSQDSRALEIGTLTLYAGATYLDPHGETVTTGQSYMDASCVQCGLEDVTIQIGKNVTLRRTQN